MMNQIQKSSGFSLVEIMIASTLSLVLIGGVMQIYQSSKVTYNLQNELADLQENERIALNVLNSNIRMAGFSQNIPVTSFIDRSDDPYTDADAEGNRPKLTRDGGGNNSDQITIRYQSDVDCLGQDVPATGIAINTFFIQNEELKCRGNGNAASQPLASNIESMQILYGINTSSDAEDVAPDRYVNIDAVSDVSKVTGIRIALLIRSAGAVKSQPEEYSFTLLDAPPIEDTDDVGDRHKRQVVTSTILLRNAAM